MLPPLTIEAADIDRAVDILDEVFRRRRRRRCTRDAVRCCCRRSGSGIGQRRGFDPIADSPVSDADRSTLRPPIADDAGAIHELIDEHLAEGHLLPRALDEIAVHAHRFVVAVQDDDGRGVRRAGAAEPRSPKSARWS